MIKSQQTTEFQFFFLFSCEMKRKSGQREKFRRDGFRYNRDYGKFSKFYEAQKAVKWSQWLRFNLMIEILRVSCPFSMQNANLNGEAIISYYDDSIGWECENAICTLFASLEINHVRLESYL